MLEMLRKISKVLYLVLTFLGSIVIVEWLAFRVHDLIVYHEFFASEPFTWSEYKVTLIVGLVLGVVFGVAAVIDQAKESAEA